MKFNITPIAGDASFRNFFRSKYKKNSQIIIVSKKNKFKNTVVYDAINRFLLKNSILAPRTLKHIFSEGILVIEDFGDITFKKVLSNSKNKL